jgi:hypothetical protein
VIIIAYLERFYEFSGFTASWDSSSLKVLVVWVSQRNRASPKSGDLPRNLSVNGRTLIKPFFWTDLAVPVRENQNQRSGDRKRLEPLKPRSTPTSVQKHYVGLCMGLTLYPWRSFIPGECRNSILKLGHDRFLPNPFQFIVIHLSSYHRRCMV